MMLIMAISAVLSILEILWLSFQGVVAGILSSLIFGYSFLILYSLYDTFKQEYRSGFRALSVQYQAEHEENL